MKQKDDFDLRYFTKPRLKEKNKSELIDLIILFRKHELYRYRMDLAVFGTVMNVLNNKKV